MPRLFTGIEIPAATKEDLARIKGGLPSARWIDPENYHLTLRFIGDIDGRMAPEVAEMLARIDRRSFSLDVEGLGTFGSKRPHAIIARIAPSRALSELRTEQERLMQRIGLPPETRRFSPHITLARLKGAGERDIADYLTSTGPLAIQQFAVERFVLFSAKESVGGGPYVVEEAYPLFAGTA